MPSNRRVAQLAAVIAVCALATAPVGAQQRCTVGVERIAQAIEYRPIPYGGEVDIHPTLVVNCGARKPAGVTVTEHLPTDVEVVPGFGTPPDTVAGRDLTWRIDLSSVKTGDAVSVTYRLYVLPDPARLVVSPTVQIDWPMDIEVNLGLQSERHPGPDPDPLVVQARPGARRCERMFEHVVRPPVVDPGEPFTVDLQLHTERCALPGPRHRAVIAVQPPRNDAERVGLVTAVRTLLREIDDRDPGQKGMAGLYVNAATDPVRVPPTVDRGWVVSGLESAPLDPTGADAAAAFAGATAMLPHWLEHHEVIYYISQAGAPRADAAALRARLADAAAQGVEVVPMCAGGGCDPALTYAYAESDLAALARTIGVWEIPRRHGGAPMEMRRLGVRETLQPYVVMHPGTARPQVSETTDQIEWRGLSIPPDGTVHLTYRAHIDRWGRYPVGASGRVTFEDDSGQALASDLLLPAFVTVRRSPAAPDDPCRVALSKSASPALLPLGNAVSVTLAFQPYCETMKERMNVVLSLDRSGSMAYGDTEFAYVKFAARALAEMLAVDTSGERRFGLISHGDPPVVEIPLTNNPDVIAARIDRMIARGQDNLARSIDAGARMLRDARPPSGERPGEILVVLSDGGQTYPAETAIPAAQAALADGITVVAACARTSDAHCDVVRQLTGEAQYAFEVESIDRILATFVDLGMRLRQIPLREATITDDLPAHMWYVPGSSLPPAEVSGRRLTWRLAGLASLGGRVSYEARPLLLGPQAVNTWADLRYTDAAGRTGYRVFPVPTVTTYASDPEGPCAAVVDHRVQPSTVAVGQSVTLTMTARTTCPRKDAPVDVVLVVDCSSTMRNFGRMTNAKAAIRALLDSLDPTRARAGLVAFTDEILARVPLTTDLDQVRTAADQLIASGGTDIAPALEAARGLLGWTEGTEALVVLLTDGLTQGSVADMRTAASAMKAQGVTISTFCAGSCDAVLAELASRPDLAYTVADSTRLVGLYRDLLRTVRGDYAHHVEIVDPLSPLVDVVPDALAPPPDTSDPPGGGQGARITWRAPEVPGEGLRMTYRVVPRAPGKVPLALAEMTYRYGQGAAGAAVHRVWFPVPVLDVTGGTPPTATPVVTPMPTATPDPTETPTPTATAVPTWRSIYLPRTDRAGGR
jgi:Mg-chelatase subunit ChlD